MALRQHGSAKERGKILERQLLALELKKSGFSYRQIGERLNCSHEQARQDVEKELTRLAGERDGNVEALRELELQRLEKVIKALDHWIESGNTQAVGVYLRAMERKAKLLGLDAPEKKDLNLSSSLTWADVVRGAQRENGENTPNEVE